MPHLFVDISSHGFGHLAQTAPLLNALGVARPELKITLRSGLPRERLAARLKVNFDHLAEASDFGYVMIDPLRIDLPATAQRYRAVHADWSTAVVREASLLAEVGADFVLSNASYLPLAGAAAAGIPAAGCCSLNWSELFEHFFGHEDWAKPIGRQIAAAYAGAPFLALEPAMPMRALPTVLRWPPVAEIGPDRRDQLREMVAAKGRRIVLLGFGGIAMNDTAFDVAAWAQRGRSSGNGCCWLVPDGWALNDPDCHRAASFGLSFSDLLASCDAVITKPGYGTFVEAAGAGTPVLWLRRDDWPEQHCLIDWLQANVAARELLPAEIEAGSVPEALSALWRQGTKARPLADGAARVAEWLAAKLFAGEGGKAK